MIGLAHRRQWGVIKYVFLIPVYWMMTSVSAVIAFYQLVVKPHHWEKTEHGLHLPGAKPAKQKIQPEIDIRISISTEFPSKIIQIPNVLFGFLKRLLIEYIDLGAKIPENNHQTGDRLSILMLNWRDTKHVWSGGSETYIHEIAKRWVEKGHRVTLLCGWDGQSSRYEFVDGIQVIRRGGFYSVFPLVVFYYLVKLRGRFDVVVDCENGMPFFTPLYSRLPKVRLIHHVHQEVFRKLLKFPLSTIAMFLDSKIVPGIYKDTEILTVSESSKDDILSRDSNNLGISVINPGIDHLKFIRSKKTNDPSFVYLGRLKPYKNIDHAIYAFSKLVKKYPSSTFSIAGTGESLNPLMKLTKKLHLEKSVIFHGRVDDEKRAKLLAQSWASIQPSSIEGWGITVIEANASKTPVIAADVKGLKDSVVRGATGLLFPAGDTDKLAVMMEELIVNSALRNKLSEQAYQWSLRFNWNDSSVAFEKVLDRKISEVKGVIPAIELT
jgi:glycosyltransferase involved in cell wall biosynthesis